MALPDLIVGQDDIIVFKPGMNYKRFTVVADYHNVGLELLPNR
jgi:hypothetical protein